MTLAVPSTGMILAEWWAFEVVVLMSGMLSDPQVSVSTMGVLMNLNALIYMVPRGMSGAHPPQSLRRHAKLHWSRCSSLMGTRLCQMSRLKVAERTGSVKQSPTSNGSTMRGNGDGRIPLHWLQSRMLVTGVCATGAASTRVSNELGAARPAIAKRAGEGSALCLASTSRSHFPAPSRSKYACTLTKAPLCSCILHPCLTLPACKSARVAAAWTAIVLGGGSAGLLAVVCYLLRQPLVGIFTKDPQVIANAQQIFYVMCFTIFTDGVNVSIEGTCHQSPLFDRLALLWTPNLNLCNQ